MSEENVDLVRRLLDMFARRDHEGVFEFYDPEIEWDATTARESIPDLADVYRGNEAFGSTGGDGCPRGETWSSRSKMCVTAKVTR